MMNDIPAVYCKILFNDYALTNFNYDLHIEMSILEWVDITASVTIQSVELDINDLPLSKDTVGKNTTRAHLFNEGFPLFAAI